MAALLLRRKGDHLVLLLVKRLSHNMLELAVMVEVEEDVKRDGDVVRFVPGVASYIYRMPVGPSGRVCQCQCQSRFIRCVHV